MREDSRIASAGQAVEGAETLPEWQLVNELVAAGLARGTRAIYRSSQGKFEHWCA